MMVFFDYSTTYSRSIFSLNYIFQKKVLPVYSTVKKLSKQIIDGCNFNGGVFFLKKVVKLQFN